jgi:alcohol dehydrogenase (cytochrome c)
MMRYVLFSGALLASWGVCAQAQQELSGAELFEGACAACHGANGRGGQIAPSMLPRVASEQDDGLIAFLRTGNPERGMPPAAVADAQLPRLVEHLRFLVATADDVETTTRTTEAQPRNRAVENFKPIDSKTLLDPDPADWLWFSRTPDAQRFSPLDQINTENVRSLGLAWARGLPNGLSYAIPLVHDGVMYLATPESSVIALDATTGDPIWEYRRTYADEATARQGRAKTLAMFDDLVYFTAPDSAVVALDAKTGAVRWEATVGERGHSSGAIVVDGKVISGGNCIAGPRDNCVISAHDAHTGALLWKFNTVQGGADVSGADTWAGVPVAERLASAWGLPGSYDPQRNLLYWGIANPMPTSRAERHGGDGSTAGVAAPADLYSNSTVALDPATGELKWYYQHLPGDDWDLDMNQERTLAHVKLSPDPAQVRWINPALKPGEERDVVVNVGEGGGLWVLDAATGEFLWATPFPFDTDNSYLADIDVNTGKTYINQELFVDQPGERNLICYLNTRSYWPTAYDPGRHSLYVPYIRNCLDMTSAAPATATREAQREQRIGAPEPGVPLDELNGLAKVNLDTGAITHWPMGRIPTNSAMLATAGNLIFWGDLAHHYRAMDADSGAVLWQTTLGGPISMSNITYAVNGRQYVAVIVGETLARQTLTTGGMGPIPLDLGPSTGNAALYVFALPEKR